MIYELLVFFLAAIIALALPVKELLRELATREASRPSQVASTSLRPSPVTLNQIMRAVAVLAVAFASLPWDVSVALAVAVSGILGLKGWRLPLVTDLGGTRFWPPWAAWCLALAACPVAMIVVGRVYWWTGPPAFTGPRPWAAGVVDALYYAHLVICVIAAVSVVLLVREGFRWRAWAAVVATWVIACMVASWAWMATTGVHET